MTETRCSYLFLVFLAVLVLATATASDTKTMSAEIRKIDSLNHTAFTQKRSDVAKALNNLFVAENLATSVNYQKGLATTYLYEGGIYYQNGYDKRALSIYYKALQLFKAIKDTLNIARVSQQIGLSLESGGKTDEALQLYRESLNVYNRLNNKEEIVNVKNSMGVMDLNARQYDKAEQQFREALAVSTGIGYVYGEKKAYYNLGLLEEKKRNFPSAASFFKQSLAGDEVLQDVYGAALNRLQLSSLQQQQYRHEEAIALAKEAYANAASLPALALMKEAATRINQIYHEQGDLAKAAQWQDSVVKVMHIQFDNEKEYALNFIDVIRNQDAKNTNAEKDLERQKQVQKEQLLIITVGTFILIIVAVLAVLALVNYQRQRFFGKELKQKNEIIEKNSASLDQLNKEISHQNALLEEDNRTKNKLLSIISHDLRTPLVNTKGVLNLVNQGMVPPEEANRLLQLLETQYLGTTSLLDNLLFWIKGQMDGKPDDKIKVGLYHLVKNLEEEHRMPLNKKNIHFRNRIDKEVAIITEKEMIRIVCRNLISNAIKFTNENGYIDVLAEIDTGDRLLHLSVKDSGIGMTKEVIGKVNAKEYYNTTGTSHEKGSGFGLMLCRDLIERAGGELVIQSEPGHGSTITIRMPVA